MLTAFRNSTRIATNSCKTQIVDLCAPMHNICFIEFTLQLTLNAHGFTSRSHTWVGGGERGDRVKI